MTIPTILFNLIIFIMMIIIKVIVSCRHQSIRIIIESDYSLRLGYQTLAWASVFSLEKTFNDQVHLKVTSLLYDLNLPFTCCKVYFIDKKKIKKCR